MIPAESLALCSPRGQHRRNRRADHRPSAHAAAYDADLRRLCAAHGASAIDAALKLIEKRSERDQRADNWDAQQHAFEVKRGVERVLRERRRRASELFHDAESLPLGWR
jgi:hypothetical protein